GRLGRAHGIGDRIAALRGYRQDLGQRPRRLPRRAQEALVPASVPPAAATLVALAAAYQGINGDSLTWLEAAHRASHRHHGTGTLVAHPLRVGHRLRTDTACGVVVHVRATDPHG